MAVWRLESSLESGGVGGQRTGRGMDKLGGAPCPSPAIPRCMHRIPRLRLGTADGHGGSLSSLSYACSAPAIVGPDDSLQLLRLPLPSAALLSLAIALALQLAIDTDTNIDCRQDGFDPAPSAAIRGHQDA
jgi:hypothetical protein